jgi:hypothetical protein
MATKRPRAKPHDDFLTEVELAESSVLGPAGEIRTVEVVRPSGDEPHDAPTLRRLQAEGRATHATGSLLDVAVKSSGTGHALSDKLAKLRRD